MECCTTASQIYLCSTELNMSLDPWPITAVPVRAPAEPGFSFFAKRDRVDRNSLPVLSDRDIARSQILKSQSPCLDSPPSTQKRQHPPHRSPSRRGSRMPGHRPTRDFGGFASYPSSVCWCSTFRSPKRPEPPLPRHRTTGLRDPR